jgi:hypothetical protein
MSPNFKMKNLFVDIRESILVVDKSVNIGELDGDIREFLPLMHESLLNLFE